MGPLVEKVGNIYNQAASAQRQQELNAVFRSKWVGGGVGLTGAVKGAITAKALNAGTDFLHSFGDSQQTGKISEQFKSRQHALLNKESTYRISERSIYNCIMSIFKSAIDYLLQKRYLSSLSIEPIKLAIYSDTYPDIDKKIDALKKEIREMDSTTADAHLTRISGNLIMVIYAMQY